MDRITRAIGVKEIEIGDDKIIIHHEWYSENHDFKEFCKKFTDREIAFINRFRDFDLYITEIKFTKEENWNGY